MTLVFFFQHSRTLAWSLNRDIVSELTLNSHCIFLLELKKVNRNEEGFEGFSFLRDDEGSFWSFGHGRGRAGVSGVVREGVVYFRSGKKGGERVLGFGSEKGWLWVSRVMKKE